MRRDNNNSNNNNNNHNNHHYWNQKSIQKTKDNDINGMKLLSNSTSNSSKWISLQDARILGCEWWKCDGNRTNYNLQYHHITENHNRPVLKYPNGDMYLGGWAKCRSGLDKPQGFGVFVSFDLILLVGQWEQGHLQGYARQLWLPQSNIWRNNYDPLSCIQTDNGIGLPFLYFGTFQHSKKNDLKATVVLKDGTTRIGPWKDDLPVGDWWQDHTKMRTPIWEIKRLLSFHTSSFSDSMIPPHTTEEKTIHNRNNVIHDHNIVDNDNNDNDIDSLVVQDGEIPIRTAVINRNDIPPPISSVMVPAVSSTTPRGSNHNKRKSTQNRFSLDNHHHHHFLHTSIEPIETPKQQQQHSIESFLSLQNQSPAVRRATALLQQTSSSSSPTNHIRTTTTTIPTKTPTSHTTNSNNSTTHQKSSRRRRRSVLFLQQEEEEQKDDKEDTRETRELTNHRETINMISQQDNSSTAIVLESTLQSKQQNGWIGPKRLEVLLRHKQEANFSDIASTLSVHGGDDGGGHDNDGDPNLKNPKMIMMQDEPFQPPSHIMTHESSSHKDYRSIWLQQASSSASPPTTPRTLSDIAIDGLGTDYLRDRIMVLSSEERDLDFVEIDIRDDFFTISDLDGGDSTTKGDGQQQQQRGGCCSSTTILCSHPDSMRGSFHYHQNRLLGGGDDDDESSSNDDPTMFSILGSRQLNNSPSHIVAGYGGEVFDFTTIDSNPIQVGSLLRQQQLQRQQAEDEERRGEGLIELETMSSLKSQSCSGGGTSDNHQMMIDDSQKSIGWFGWFGI